MHHRIPLGLLLLSRGLLSDSQLRQALDAQESHRGRLGVWLQKLGFASEAQITAALGVQWACPVLHAPPPAASHLCLVPLRLIEHLRVLPVSAVPQRRLLHVAFCDGIDYAAVHALQMMLDYQVEPCIIGEAALARSLQELAQAACERELVFESGCSAVEMARIASSYAVRLRAAEARVVTCGEYIWFRVWRQAPTDLLFLKPASAEPGSASPN